jgi:hypothetical protein
MAIKKFKIQNDHCVVMPTCNDSFDVKAIASGMKSFIEENNCKKLVLNLKGFNLVDVGNIAILASAYHFSKYSKEGIFRIIVDSEEIKKALSYSKLENTEIIAEENITDIYCAV